MHTPRIVKENWLGVSLIALTWLIFFWRIIFGGQVYFLDDLKILYYPIEHAYAQFQATWQLPVWSPYFGFGQPLLAWGQLGFFTPLHLLLRLLHLHPVILLNISTAAYIAIGLAGMYVFLRRQKLSSLSATLGAIVFGFCGFTIGHLNHVNFYTATMLLPWLLLSISFFLEKPNFQRTALLALIAAAIPLSGQPQISLYTFIIASIYGSIFLVSEIVRRSQHKSEARSTNFEIFRISDFGFRIFFLTLLAGLLAFCLASFAVLPLREFLPVSDRSDALPISELYEFSYPPQHAITLLFPYYFGNHEAYWGAKNFQELAAYVGILPLGLAFIALIFWRKNINLSLTAALLVIIAVVFAPGKYSPIYTYLVENHIFTSLAIPGRFVYFFDVGVAILAALGMEVLLSLGKRRWLTWTAEALLALTAANLLWWGWNYNPLRDAEDTLASAPFAETLREYKNQTGFPARLYASEVLPLGGAVVTTADPTEPIGPKFTIHQPLHIEESALCIALPLTVTTTAEPTTITVAFRDDLSDHPFLSQQASTASIAARALLKVCSPEITLRHGKNIIVTLTGDHTSTIQAYQRLPVGNEEGVLYVRTVNPTPEQLERSKKTAHLVIFQDQSSEPDLEKNLLLRHIQATADTSAARWIGALGIGDYRAFIEAFFANDRDPFDGDGLHALRRFRNLVNFSGITHLAQAVSEHEASSDPVVAAGYTLTQESIAGSTHLRLYENPEAFPKAFLVGNAIWEPGPDQTRFALHNSDYDGRRLIFVNGPTPPHEGTLPNSEDLNLKQFTSPVFEESRAEITRYEPTEVEIQVETAEPAWLVLTDSYTPQWHTFIDDAEAPPYIANTVFRAAQIPAGSHTVSFRYTSPAIKQANWLTILGLIATGACLLPWLLGRFRGRSAAAPPGGPG